MFCPNCGNKNVEDARFCQNCGKDLTQVAVGQPPVKYAGFWRRFAASIIDGLVIGIAYLIFSIPLFFAFDEVLPDAEGPWFLIVYLAAFILSWLYYSLMESSAKQATLGKMALDIIVTGEAGNRISFARATGRYFAKYLSQLIFYIGYIMIAFTKKKQGLHDLIAITLVVKKQ